MTYKADTSVICKCDAIINKDHMHKHLQTAKHERDIIGRENVELVDPCKYKPRNN